MDLTKTLPVPHRHSGTLICGIALAVLVFTLQLAAFAQSSLPPDVQADVLKRKIYDAAKREDLKAVLAALDDYHKLNVTMPPPVVLLEAKAAWAAKDPIRAFRSLEEFLKVAQRGEPQYNEALALYEKYKEGSQVAETRRKAARIAEANSKLPGLLSGIGRNMRDIPTGSFQMGDLAGDGRAAHSVTLKSFRLSAYEVTFEQYDMFAAATGRALPDDRGWGRGTRPVIKVSWDDAQAFAVWLSEQSGLKYRLPSEAEWEYAARAGTTTEYPWGNAFSAEQANGSGTSGRDTFSNSAPVGSFPANTWGLHDMIGNVWEWTGDCWNNTYVGAPNDGSAWLSGDCTRRVIRGGSWLSGPTDLRVSSRSGGGTTDRFNFLGFRLAQDL